MSTGINDVHACTLALSFNPGCSICVPYANPESAGADAIWWGGGGGGGGGVQYRHEYYIEMGE